MVLLFLFLIPKCCYLKLKIFSDITMPAKLFIAQLPERNPKFDFGYEPSIFEN